MQKLSWRNSKFHIYPNLTHKDCSSRKLRIRCQQASSEQADAQSRRQVSREMLHVHWHDYQLSRLSVHYLLRDSRRLSSQPEKLYAEALLEVLSKVIAEEINTTLKNECMACYDPAVQVHSCYLNNPREKVDRNFDNAFQLVDLWSANEMTFEKTKDKIQVAVKDKDLYLTRSDLLRNVFFMDRLKAAVIKLVF